MPLDDLSVAEQGEVEHALMLLEALDSYLGSFRSAVDLFEHVESFAQSAARRLRSLVDPTTGSFLGIQDEALAMAEMVQRYSDWASIPAKDAAMTIYQFGETVKAFRNSLGRSLVLRQGHDTAEARKATRLFDTAFPRTVKLRHALAHQAEYRKSVEHLQAHADRGVYAEWSVEGRLFTVNGRTRNALD